MNLRPLRSKIAALAILFFVGTFAGQIGTVLDKVRGTVDRGVRVTDELKMTVTTIRQAVDQGADSLRAEAETLKAQLAVLQDEVKGGHATAGQAQKIDSILGRLREIRSSPGNPGPPGPQGEAGPPGSAAEPAPTTSSTAPGGTPGTTRPPTTTTTRTAPTTTTTRCAVGVGRLLKVGC